MGNYLDATARKLFGTKEKKRLPEQIRRAKKTDEEVKDEPSRTSATPVDTAEK